MSYLPLICGVLTLSLVTALGVETNTIKLTDSIGSASNKETSLVSFSPFARLANISEMLKTNGLECLPNISADRVIIYVYNHSTNDMGCLRMPATNLFKITLLDEHKNQVKKTVLGATYGLPLSQGQVDGWLHHGQLFHQSKFIHFLPSGTDKYDMPTEIGGFNIKETFEIEKSGEYELHLQMRLIQVGQDSSSKFHYPVTWLPEVTTKFEIRLEDIQR